MQPHNHETADWSWQVPAHRDEPHHHSTMHSPVVVVGNSNSYPSVDAQPQYGQQAAAVAASSTLLPLAGGVATEEGYAYPTVQPAAATAAASIYYTGLDVASKPLGALGSHHSSGSGTSTSSGGSLGAVLAAKTSGAVAFTTGVGGPYGVGNIGGGGIGGGGFGGSNINAGAGLAAGGGNGAGCSLPFEPDMACLAYAASSPKGRIGVLNLLPLLVDMLSATFAVQSAVLSMLIALSVRLKSRAGGLWEGGFVDYYVVLYPIITMLVVVVRTFELCARKEVYYLLLQRRIVCDWQNYGFFVRPSFLTHTALGHRQQYNILVESSFTLYWLATFGVLVYWITQGEDTKAQFVVVVILQTVVLYNHFRRTLMGEYNLVSLNKALEDRDRPGAMNFARATEFLTGLSFLEEEALRAYTSFVMHERPSRWACLAHGRRSYRARMDAWRAGLRGDVQRLAGSSETAWRTPGCRFPLTRWLANNLYGRRLIHDVLPHHPDFAHATPALWLYRAASWAVLLVCFGSVVYVEWEGFKASTNGGSGNAPAPAPL